MCFAPDWSPEGSQCYYILTDELYFDSLHALQYVMKIKIIVHK